MAARVNDVVTITWSGIDICPQSIMGNGTEEINVELVICEKILYKLTIIALNYSNLFQFFSFQDIPQGVPKIIIW